MRCLESFSRQQRLDSHIKRKLPCKINNLNYLMTQEIYDEIPEDSKNSVNLRFFREFSGQKNDVFREFSGNLPTFQKSYDSENKMFKLSCDNADFEKTYCYECKKSFSTVYNLNKHCRRFHDIVTNEINSDELKKTRKELEEIRVRLAELENRPPTIEQHNNQILQVVCVSNDQNYLDMLTEKIGFDRALGYIKDCALSDILGDCKLLQKIYFDSSEACIKYLDKNKTKIEYFNEKNERIIDKKGLILVKKLANNLQNSYLKGVNYLINQSLNDNNCPNKFLEDYDLQAWNQHIYDLSNLKYQKKLISCLEIPIM